MDLTAELTGVAVGLAIVLARELHWWLDQRQRRRGERHTRAEDA